MLILSGVSYTHPNKELLFSNVDISLNAGEKAALIGNNGTGKSTLLKIIAGQLAATGNIKIASDSYYVPQHFGQYDQMTIAEAIGVAGKLNALKEILGGNVSEVNLDILNEDWTIEERCFEAFQHWGLNNLDLAQPMHTLSGGQKTKVFLAGIQVQEPPLVLLDEPSNHLDISGRQLLYEYIQTTNHSLIVVSHDRILLNLLTVMYELSKDGIHVYGGNYDFYALQKQNENEALQQDLKSKEKAYRKAKETERETMERQQKLDARGKRKQEKSGLPTISMNTFRNNAEKSTAKMKAVHEGKLGTLSKEIDDMRKGMPGIDKMRLAFNDSNLHKGKILVSGKDVNFNYGNGNVWQHSLQFEITSGSRIAVKGDNGSGKTTLIKMILGELQPTEGIITRNINRAVYIDQDYSLVDNSRTVYEQVQQFNTSALAEHEVK
ncbi:MAG TPA: ATP-binding cassette domain-containing protein, partial [Chitinophagaceae bacterium]|nr:ATP-binding cassette domain-containing protein [Chitinophagaceae bacterium]